MLKYRLFFGTLMVLFLIGLILLGGRIDGSITKTIADDKPVQGSIFCLLMVIVTFLAVPEMAKLAARKDAKVFVPLAIVSSIVFATSWYWRQFSPEPVAFHLHYTLFASAFCLLGIFLWQGLLFGADGVIANCAATYFTIFYLSFLGSFILGLRIEFGPWALLMFIFTIKSSDTGAYAIGRLFGKHKFSPKISPGKTWEGLAGAMLFGVIAALCFSHFCGIMPWHYGIAFGAVFGFLGQLGDLAESMIKRDAGQKDSSSNIPGFGGVLDIIDSPLATAPAAYLFFMLVCN
jgi:phosphatidate cytidylyltransferase